MALQVTSDQPGFGLYIHWPFCLAKCPYCDFNSHVREQVDQAAWQQALLDELRYWAARAKPQQLTSIFFGGGTPSLMAPQTVEALIAEAHKLWPVADELEITLEANPTSVEAAKLRDFRQAGVNRLSMGIQALRADDLQRLGRQHSVAEALAALEMAATTFGRYSFDLITFREGQTLEGWRGELAEALQFGAQHMSIYHLTIEPGTQFATLHQRGSLVLPSDEEGAAFYDLTQQMMDGAGLPAYEISNHAALGQECRHNLTYWHYGDYVGIGPGAHGRVTDSAGRKLATRTHRAPEEWLQRVQAQGHALTNDDMVPITEQRDEVLLMGLRTREGISRARLRAQFGQDAPALYNAQSLQSLIKHGFITLSDTHLLATPEGRLRLNKLVEMLAV
jgi:oxygen-independent coproporphyrinogen-3 oxidase